MPLNRDNFFHFYRITIKSSVLVQAYKHMMTSQKNYLSQVKFILPTCKTKVGTGGKRLKTIRSPKSAAPSINNLKRFTLSGISLDVKIIKKKTETHLQQKQHKHRITEKQISTQILRAYFSYHAALRRKLNNVFGRAR